MTPFPPAARYRFGVFEADLDSGELRRQGIRIKLNVQPFQVLTMLLARPGEVLTREEICRELWPEGTFVDYEHGVNSAVNRIREALGDQARSPRFVETLARRGYRFVAPVERIPAEAKTAALPDTPRPEPGRALLAQEHELPKASRRTVQVLFLALELMYLGFYVGSLANLPEIAELFSGFAAQMEMLGALIVTAALLIPVRVFLITATLMHPPGARGRMLRMWPFLLPFDILWAMAPFLLLHHMSVGLALACMAPLVYAPFAQRSLILMGVGED